MCGGFLACHVSFLQSHVAGETFSLYYHLFPWHWHWHCTNVTIEIRCFFCSQFWNKKGILGMIYGASHSFVLAKSFLAWPSGIQCVFLASRDLIHSPPSLWFLIMLQQLDMIQIYRERPLQFKQDPQPSPNKLGCTGNKWGGFPSPTGSTLCVKSNHFLRTNMQKVISDTLQNLAVLLSVGRNLFLKI